MSLSRAIRLSTYCNACHWRCNRDRARRGSVTGTVGTFNPVNDHSITFKCSPTVTAELSFAVRGLISAQSVIVRAFKGMTRKPNKDKLMFGRPSTF